MLEKPKAMRSEHLSEKTTIYTQHTTTTFVTAHRNSPSDPSNAAEKALEYKNSPGTLNANGQIW